jgi:uncharacterized repeat protein (TIGR03803 family)
MKPELITPATSNYVSTPVFLMKNRTRQCGPYALALALMLGLATVTTSAHGQTFTVLHSFGGADGDNSNHGAGLTRDAAGNLYGTTDRGGDLTCGDVGCGTVYKIDRSGKETVLHRFTSTPDGDTPFAGVIRDTAGNLYGTTLTGGASGYGTVFKVDAKGKETVLHSFTGKDGALPRSGVVRDAAGNLYGTTETGGSLDYGTVFRLEPNGKMTMLHAFTGGADGANPQVGVILDKAGNLYGIAGPVLFKLSKNGKETVLYKFPEGLIAYAGLTFCRNALCGTTAYGGTSGMGTVFKLDQRREFTVLYNFTGGADGGYPLAGVIQDAEGNLYGEAAIGGYSTCEDEGCGTVFKLSPTGEETTLYTFYDGSDGGFPAGGLVRDAAGNLYGTTTGGGGWGDCPEYFGCGTVFKLTP